MFLLKLVIVNVWIYTNHYSSNLKETHQLTTSTDLNEDIQSKKLTMSKASLHSYHGQQTSSAPGLLFYLHRPAQMNALVRITSMTIMRFTSLSYCVV